VQKLFGTKDAWREREKRWAAFHEWENQQPPVERSPADIIADLGTILDWLPVETRSEDPDPQKRGIQILRDAFVKLDSKL
jgi:hypothetical protein